MNYEVTLADNTTVPLLDDRGQVPYNMDTATVLAEQRYGTGWRDVKAHITRHQLLNTLVTLASAGLDWTPDLPYTVEESIEVTLAKELRHLLRRLQARPMSCKQIAALWGKPVALVKKVLGDDGA